MVNSVGTGDWGQHITNNNNIRRRRIKWLGEKNKKEEEEWGRKEGLSSAASCGGFSDRERKKKKRRYISIYRQGGKEWAGAALSPLPAFTTQPWADSHTLWCTKWSSPSRSHQGSPHWHQEVEPVAEGPYGVLSGREKEIKRRVDGKLFYQWDGQCSTPNNTLRIVWGNYRPYQPRVILVAGRHISEVPGNKLE